MSAIKVQPVYGNYHGYYSKRPSTNDPRLAVLPRSIFDNARVLDVGCNEGLITCQIGQSCGARRVIGVDIDDALVRAAWKRRRSMWSQQQPGADEVAVPEDVTESRKRKRSEDAPLDPAPIPDYFPVSCEHMFGPLPISPGTSTSMFPHNVVFRTADWVNTEITEDAEGYDVVIAFSISKWIHLNGGDAGLMRFFERVFAVLKPGGVFVLEPQEWDTYGKAKRLDVRLRETAKGLVLRPDGFEKTLTTIGFLSAEHLGKVGNGGFKRPVDMYKKPM